MVVAPMTPQDRAQYLREAGWHRSTDYPMHWVWKGILYHEAAAYRLQRSRDRRMLRARGWLFNGKLWERIEGNYSHIATFDRAVAIERAQGNGGVK